MSMKRNGRASVWQSELAAANPDNPLRGCLSQRDISRAAVSRYRASGRAVTQRQAETRRLAHLSAIAHSLVAIEGVCCP